MRKIAPLAWREVRTRKQIPAVPGVYAVYMDGKLVYLGSTVNLRNRAGLHLRILRPDPPTYDSENICKGHPSLDMSLSHRVKVKPSRKMGEWLMREYRLIHRLQPEGNRIGVGMARADRNLLQTAARVASL